MNPTLRPISISQTQYGRDAAHQAVADLVRADMKERDSITSEERASIWLSRVSSSNPTTRTPEWYAAFDEVLAWYEGADDKAALVAVGCSENTQGLDVAKYHSRWEVRCLGYDDDRYTTVYSDTSKLRAEGARSFIRSQVRICISRNQSRASKLRSYLT